jgi:hypothetical protein
MPPVPPPPGGGPVLRPPAAGDQTGVPNLGPSPYAGAAGGAYAPTPVLGQAYGQAVVNNSGMQNDVPAEIMRGWNWGAFFFTWIWLLNHGLKTWGWAYLIGGIVARSITRSTNVAEISIALSVVDLGLRIALGIMGNRLAWQNRRFDGVEDFKRCERTWAWWALGVFIAAFVIGILIGVLLAGALMTLRGNRGVGFG